MLLKDSQEKIYCSLRVWVPILVWRSGRSSPQLLGSDVTGEYYCVVLTNLLFRPETSVWQCFYTMSISISRLQSVPSSMLIKITWCQSHRTLLRQYNHVDAFDAIASFNTCSTKTSDVFYFLVYLKVCTTNLYLRVDSCCYLAMC